MIEYKIQLKNEKINDLIISINKGPIMPNGKHKFEEKQIAKLGSLKIEIFANEHPPPHFRVIMPNGESNNFKISDGEPLNGEPLKKYFRNIKKWLETNREFLILEWNSFRPTNCPVGEYKDEHQ